MAEFDKKGIQLVAHGEGGSSARLAWWNEGPSTPAPGFSIRRGPLPASPSVCYDRPARSPACVRRLLGAAGQGAKTQEQIALNLQKSDSGAISTLKVAEAVQNRAAADAAVKQAEASLNQAQAAQRQAESQVVAAQSAQRQYEAGLAEA